MFFQRRDDRLHRGGEVGAAMSVGEQVDVAARPITHSVNAEGVAAGEGESLSTRDREGDFRQSAMAWFHGRKPMPRPGG
ncbi:hypothetical protein B0T44_07985 [Nocardia donostiensis]|uniref:Uncharacterized protein n=1 Tax=Nocardia donostiensis TaxID=1538463 RepID=A0A1W0AS77_9NOCA|nr:hypothetical protein B0T46_15380 [Nocardia donostiensis]OQS13089.1 hypothetical protein B0T36_21240 [Nocardia donostiensis]OQS21541.1 hypothetical protein B0T44_07985 [Nocardia donostiensis]